MSLAVSVIVNQARLKFNDPNPPPVGGASTISDVEMIGYVAEGQAAVCQLKPDAYSYSGVIPLIEGAFQKLPITGNAGSLPVGTQLVDLYSNASDGSAIRMIDREALDHSHPNWTGGTNRKLVRRWFYDEDKPKDFIVTPPNDASGSLNGTYFAVPVRPAALVDLLVIDDTYEDALVSYVISQCYAKQTARYDSTKMGAFLTEFINMVSGRSAPQSAQKPTPEK